MNSLLSSPLLRSTLMGLSVLALSACGKQEAPAQQPPVRPVKVMVVGSGDAQLQRTLTGQVRAAERVELAFQVPGKLIELPAREGAQVEEGQLLGRLDPRDYAANLKAAQAELEKSQANFARAKDLLEKDFISKAEYDRLKANRDVAESEVAKASKAAEDSELRAPFTGTIAKRYVENFTDVRAKEPVVSLQNVSALEIVVDVPERLVALRGGDPAEVEIVGSFATVPGREFPLEIKEYATRADPVTQTFQYVLIMPRPEGVNILPGMTASVRAVRADVSAGEQQTRFVIPALAVFADASGQAHVWVVDPETKTVHQRQVETGDLRGTANIEVVEGLEGGETIAIAGVSQLRENQRVRPLDKVEF